MPLLADLVANARATVGHIIRYITSGGVNPMPNRQYLDFEGNCTVRDSGESIVVRVPDVPAGSIRVGNTVTLVPGSMAYVENVGTDTHALLNFGIPRGDAGPEVELLWAAVHALQDTVQQQAETIAALQATVAANDAAAVHLAGAETVTGDKTFTGGVAVPTVATSDDSTAAASTAWVNAKLAAIYYYARGSV